MPPVVPLGEISIPVLVRRGVNPTASAVMMSLYHSYDLSEVCHVVPVSLCYFIRSCMWNSGTRHGTIFSFTMEYVNIRRARSIEADRIRSIHTDHTVHHILSGPGFTGIPRSNANSAIDYVSRRYEVPSSQLIPYVVNLRVSIPLHLVRDKRKWQGPESVRNCLEKLVYFTSKPEARGQFRTIYEAMNRAGSAYVRSERAPTMSQKFLNTVTGVTASYPDEMGQPDGLNITLRPHQRRSLEFCLKREKDPGEMLSVHVHNYTDEESGEDRSLYYSPVLNTFSFEPIQPCTSGLLLDEMGLGKTAITLALHLANPPSENSDVGGTLVVCPPSLIHQWVAEAKKTLRDDNEMYIFHGARRKRDLGFLTSQKLVVTTYGIIHSERAFNATVSCLEAVVWNRIVFDESHALRNKSTQTYAACRALRANYKWIVTGTPFVSSVDDIPNQMNMIAPVYNLSFRPADYDGTMKKFLYILLSMAVRHTTTMRIEGMRILDLQDVRHHTVPVEWLRQRESEKYEEEQSIIHNNLRMMTSGVALSQVAKLQKRCAIGFGHLISFDRRLSGFQVMTGEEVGYATENISDCPICMEPVDHGHMAMVRSCKHLFCAVCIQTLLQHNGHACPLCRGPLTNRNVCVPPPMMDDGERDDSLEHNARNAKMDKVLNLITGSDVADKFIIFSNFKDVIRGCKLMLDDQGVSNFAFLPGMSLGERRRGLEKFQADPFMRALILPMRTSSSGLNVTAANKVILMEPSLHRNTERQAVGRAWRMGQTRCVNVYHMYMQNTVEEKIYELNREDTAVDLRWNYNRVIRLFDA